MEKKMNSTATSLFTVLIITHLTNQGFTAPVDPPATTRPYSSRTESATQSRKNVKKLKITINTFEVEDLKIGDKVLNPIDAKDLEMMKEMVDCIENRFNDQSTFGGEIVLFSMVMVVYILYQELRRLFKCYRKKHTKKGEIPASGDNPKEKLPPYTQFAPSSYINVENSTAPAMLQ